MYYIEYQVDLAARSIAGAKQVTQKAKNAYIYRLLSEYQSALSKAMSLCCFSFGFCQGMIVWFHDFAF
jgi:hypothetical protein